MKKIISYILLAVVAIFATACEKDSILSGSQGGVSFDIQMKSSSTTRTGDSNENGDGESEGESDETTSTPEVPQVANISPINVRIYRPETPTSPDYTTLIRRYSSIEDIPNPLYLIAGKYQIKVEGGNKTRNKAFKEPENAIERQEKLCYEGSQNFVIESQQTTENIEVLCKPINVKTNIVFDKSDSELDETGRRKYENRLISNEKITVVAMAYVASGENATTVEAIKAAADKLVFEGTGSGYFVLPESVTDIVYLFEGTHQTDGEISFVGSTSVRKGYAYTLKFQYARTPDGFAGITLQFDDTVDIIDDKFYFKPQPEMKATAGSGIDMGAVNEFKQGDNVSLVCESINDIKRLSLNDIVFFESTDSGVAAQSETIPGLTATMNESTKVTVTLTKEYFNSVGGSLQNLQFKMWDSDTDDNEPYEQVVKFRKSGIMDNSEHTYDLWGNKATIKVYIPDNTTGKTVTVKFRRSDIDDAAYIYTATAHPLNSDSSGKTWAIETFIMDGDTQKFPAYDFIPDNGSKANNNAGFPVYKPNTATGIYAGNAYTYDLYIDNELVDSYTLTPQTSQTIKGGDFSNSSMNCFKNLSKSDVVSDDWGSGNNNFVDLCVFDNGKAKLAAGTYMSMLTAGNLFTGDFKMTSTTKGTVSFGMKYAWSSRPTALKFKYQANIGEVDETGDHISGQDEASIIVAIVKWDARHGVTSGTGSPTGGWSPNNGEDAAKNSEGKSAGKIVGYGLAYPKTETNGATSMTEYYVPIVYYDINTTAADLSAANFSLVISFATSRYGDYMNGCSSSVMYVDDVEWSYDHTFANTFELDTY